MRGWPKRPQDWVGLMIHLPRVERNRDRSRDRGCAPVEPECKRLMGNSREDERRAEKTLGAYCFHDQTSSWQDNGQSHWDCAKLGRDCKTS